MQARKPKHRVRTKVSTSESDLHKAVACSNKSEWVTRVLTWGSNNNGQVSPNLAAKPYFKPCMIRELEATIHNIKRAATSIVCGFEATFVVTTNGAVYSWGKGPLGRKGATNKIARIPQLLHVVHLSVALEHAVACTRDGRLYTWGKGKGGRLGHGNNAAIACPRMVQALQDEMIIRTAAGDQHTVVLSEHGDIYAFGTNRAGQIGCGTTQDTVLPTKIARVDHTDPWANIACGANHTVATTKSKRLYAWGWSSDGRLGFDPLIEDDDAVIVLEPRRVLLPLGVEIEDVTCGHAHTLCTTSRGTVYAFGWNTHGQCGVQGECVPNPILVNTAQHHVVQARGGFAHSAALTDQGVVLTWGFGLEGQLGTGHDEMTEAPSAAYLESDSLYTLSLSLGHCHSAVVLATAPADRLPTLYVAETLRRRHTAVKLVRFIERNWKLRKLLVQPTESIPAEEQSNAPSPPPMARRGILIDEGDEHDDSTLFLTNLNNNNGGDVI